MRVFAVLLSVAIIVVFYFAVWDLRLRELGSCKRARADIEAEIASWPDRVAEAGQKELELAGLEQKVRQAETARRVSADPSSLEKMQGRLAKEWEPLTDRPGLEVLLLFDDRHEESAFYVGVNGEGPRDEVFRLLDGLARSPRPVEFLTLDLVCTNDRAHLDASFMVYYR